MLKAVLFSVLALMVLIPVSAYAEKIVYTNAFPTWYSYDCTDSSPSVWTHEKPIPRDGNVWKWFSYYDPLRQDCFTTMQTFNLLDLTSYINHTSMNYHIDTKSVVITNQTANDVYQIDCSLYYFGNIDTTSDLAVSPTLITSAIDCTGTDGIVQEVTIPLQTVNGTIDAGILSGNYTQSFMIFPNFTTADRLSWDNYDYTYAVGKFANELEINGNGFNCITIEASNWCNFYNEPWEGVKKALGEDYIGDWFYVLVFMPFPFSVFLITRNGAYAGFLSLPIMLVINTIDDVIFEVSLSMIAIASAFGFYELFRKKLHE